MPSPRSIDAIKADPELEDWRREADLVLIPLLLDRRSSQRFGPASFPPQADRLQRIAQCLPHSESGSGLNGYFQG